MDWYVGWFVLCGMKDKLVAVCYMDVFVMKMFVLVIIKILHKVSGLKHFIELAYLSLIHI